MLINKTSSPILLGIYIDCKLHDRFVDSRKTSDALPDIFSGILENYIITRIFYANGPGNFSAIKLTHIFLKTLSIINNIDLFCLDSFFFTKDRFIHAYGRIHFLKDNGKISTTILDDRVNTSFELPEVLDVALFSDVCFPCYVMPPV